MRTLDNFSRSIRLPSYIVAKMNKFDAIYATLCQELQREPRREEIAEALDLTVNQVEEILTFNADTISMDLPLSDERSASTLGDLVEDPTTGGEDGPIAELINEDLIAHNFSRNYPNANRKSLKCVSGLKTENGKHFEKSAIALDCHKRTHPAIGDIRNQTVAHPLYNEMGEFRSRNAPGRINITHGRRL